MERSALGCRTCPSILGPNNELQGVASASTTDVWAVGHRDLSSGPRSRTLIEHWDGRRWKIVPSPNITSGRNDLHAVAVITPIWAVGGFIPASDGDWQSLVLHWDGSTWCIASARFGGELLAASRDVDGTVWAAGTGPKDVWAFGWTSVDTGDIEHWDGSRWQLRRSPHGSSDFVAAIALSAQNAWVATEGLSRGPKSLHFSCGR
jgi:hypothetical protein